MSAPISTESVGQIPAAGTEGATGITTDSTVGSGASGTEPEPGSASAPTDTTREWQSRYDRDTYVLRKYFGPNFDPMVVDRALEKLNRAVTHPELNQVLNHFWNSGKFESGVAKAGNGATDEDPYESPTEKLL